jgi:hypothetical protein
VIHLGRPPTPAGGHPEAIAACHESLRREPDRTEAWYDLGVPCGAQGDQVRIEDVRRGLDPAVRAPAPWLEWQKTGTYRPLLAPKTREHRTPARKQLPSDPAALARLEQIVGYYRDHPSGPYGFERWAAELFRLTQPNVLNTASEMYFIGYSLPEADWHSRFVPRSAFINQTKGLPIGGRRRRPTGKAKVYVVRPNTSADKRICAVVGDKCTRIKKPWSKNGLSLCESQGASNVRGSDSS